MEKTFESNWLPIFAGGLLVGVAILTPVSEGIRDATDICSVSRQAVASQPAILPDADLPHPDHAPAIASNIAVTVTTSTSTATTPSTTVTGMSR
jgi:hypothetical protein